MTRNEWLLVLVGIAAVGALAAWRIAAGARERRGLLARGEIRALGRVWTSVGEWRVHARAALPAQPIDAPPIVLVHGFGGSSAYFIPTAERLGATFTVYAPDLPGHGRSDTPRGPLDVPALADALIGWMDALGIERACLVGNSMGCQIAVDAALRHPGRVSRLVLIGPTTDPRGRSVGRLLMRFLAGSLYERPSLGPILVKDYARMGRRLAAEFRFMRSDRIENKLPQLRVPTLLVRGEGDRVVPQRWLEEAARLVRSGRLAVIPGQGHAVNYSGAKPLVTSIAPFLAGPEPSVVRVAGR